MASAVHLKRLRLRRCSSARQTKSGTTVMEQAHLPSPMSNVSRTLDNLGKLVQHAMKMRSSFTRRQRRMKLM
ncbi:hypothetical protein OESDEN_17090 [Oesophagostomum dentatum]|uniref:Uncharacterized protein n=1 Tax=Oesophagostomum dentatum TaxID=61180 RepID=A0A0B1SD52_OESDE|nr:hypothetical protein OESDEN_17090 [Oesophagostomum dentatum]